ncbi:MAG TPA: metalloregulator ArsR/SmtB family transcription factor [Spirillospora sp.]|nr:metalloregulator ArsR/SmtB family transcription factor [Spirillospora sp.]
MPRSQGRRPAPDHPGVHRIDLLKVLHALADPTRMTIVQTLRADPERACGTFPVDVAPSTLSHHFRVLRESGVIRQRDDGNRRWTTLRHEDLETRFPGLLETVVAAYDRQQTCPPAHEDAPPS